MSIDINESTSAESGSNQDGSDTSARVRMLTEQELAALKRDMKASSEWMKAELEKLEPRIPAQENDSL